MKNKALQKKSKRGFRGYPVATIAFYGPTDRQATKVAVGIIRKEGGSADELQRWYSEDDVRNEDQIATEIVEFIKDHGALSITMSDRIIGCPHEEGVDYPDGEKCPNCPFWANRNRWTGKVVSD